MSLTVCTGPFAGRTAAEIKAAIRAAQDELISGGGQPLIGSAVNGSSFQFSPGLPITERLRLLQNALAQVDPSAFSPSSNISVRW